MEEKNKPTIDEMIEAYRQYSRRIDELCRQLPPPKVDFTKLPPPYRHRAMSGRIKTLSFAAVVALILLLLPLPDAMALNRGVNYDASVEAVGIMISSVNNF